MILTTKQLWWNFKKAYTFLLILYNCVKLRSRWQPVSSRYVILAWNEKVVTVTRTAVGFTCTCYIWSCYFIDWRSVNRKLRHDQFISDRHGTIKIITPPFGVPPKVHVVSGHAICKRGQVRTWIIPLLEGLVGLSVLRLKVHILA